MTKYNEAFSNNGRLEAKGQEISEGKLGILDSFNKPAIFVPDFCLNPIPTSVCHMITVYGLIELIADRYRVKGLKWVK